METCSGDKFRRKQRSTSSSSMHKEGGLEEGSLESLNENHAYLQMQYEKLERSYEAELRLIEILEKDELLRIEATYKLEEDAIQSDYEIRLNELVEGLRRANEQTESNEKRPRKHSPQSIVHLLPESAIAEDVKLICNYPNTNSKTSVVDDDEGRHRKVTVDNNRLICDGKIFHKGQSVSVETVKLRQIPSCHSKHL
uniref:Uncharacterized protein n=1 Tax=Ditylenchus dipsaci TaxID=166011 RepID=A0A915DWD8_9BILA